MPFQTLDQLMEDPHLADTGFFERLDHPTEGKIWNMVSTNKVSGGARRAFRHAPKIGQDSVDLLRELGYTDPDINAMLASGAMVDGRLKKP